MEDSSEVQCEDNKTFSEKPKRQFKSRAQLQGLEDYYNEHKYPTESMKAGLAVKLALTEKQVSGWFCHRRLKDKRIMRGELPAPGRPDLSSGVVQDRGSGLRQDSCGSTKQADHRLADLREVESRRFAHDNLPVAERNYQHTRIGDGTEMDDTSSESNSALQERFYPKNRSPFNVEDPQYRAPNGFILQSRGRVGPSGYLKIKGQRENAAITAVKRQLGRHYREDGPSLGIDFDPLPPGAFETPNKDINDYAYVPEHSGPSSRDISGIRKRSGLSAISEEMYEAAEYRSLHKSDPDNFSCRQPKQKSPFFNHSRGFPDEKSSFAGDSYSAREIPEHDDSINHCTLRKQDLPVMRLDSLGPKIASEPTESWWSKHEDVKPKFPKTEQFPSRPAALADGHKDFLNRGDRMLSNKIVKDEELYIESKSAIEHHDSMSFKMRPTNELRAGKRGREKYLQEVNPIRQSSQERPQWPRQIKGPTEMPSSFSEDETAESSSMD